MRIQGMILGFAKTTKQPAVVFRTCFGLTLFDVSDVMD